MNLPEEIRELVKLLDSVFDRVDIDKEPDDIDELCAAAIKRFGAASQILKAIEELSELQRALVRYMAWTEHKEGGMLVEDALVANIHEELADVLIMGVQLEKIFGHNADVMDAKLEHLRELVEMEK